MQIDNDLIEFIKSKFLLPKIGIQASYHAGYDCGKNGANLENCQFTYFQPPAHLAAWNEGKSDAEAFRENKYLITGPADGAQNI